MPNHNFNLWTHGAAVIVEDEQKPVFVKRNEWGVKIRQDGGENTFHFAIPTGTQLDDETVNLHEGWLLVNLNGGATIDKITMREATQGGAKLLFETPSFFSLTDIDGDNPRARHTCVVPDRPLINGPLILTAHADFDDRGGEINFRGAGALQME